MSSDREGLRAFARVIQEHLSAIDKTFPVGYSVALVVIEDDTNTACGVVCRPGTTAKEVGEAIGRFVKGENGPVQYTQTDELLKEGLN